MQATDIQALIAAYLPTTHVEVDGDGRHWVAVVVSTAFEGQARIRRHQAVYATLGNKMHTDEVHALSIKAYTPAEWARLHSSRV